MQDEDLVISGLGISSAIGQTQKAFSHALLAGASNFSVMRRPGRQFESTDGASRFLGAEIEDLHMPAELPVKELRTASLSAQVALTTLSEAWQDAGLSNVPAHQMGLVVAGSNVQQRALANTHESYREKLHFLKPSYAMTFMDTDICGLCTSVFDIRGFAYTVGGASASGQLALIQAIEAVRSKRVGCCIALGALMDLSYWECQAFRALGAMGSERYADQPNKACRPFDQNRDGFIFGESCGAIVVETMAQAVGRGAPIYARIAGWHISMDGNRNPNPSLEGEVNVITRALEMAGIAASEIDYVNPHGTGSLIGDDTELEAFRRCGLQHAFINTTKSILGHGLSAAGIVEVIATLLQMKWGRLHPSNNLLDPIDLSFNWVSQEAVEHRISNALTMSLGFGGMNTALCLKSA